MVTPFCIWAPIILRMPERTPTMSLEVIVLAAGQGTRMNSKLPKVLHDLAGQPLLGHVLRAALLTVALRQPWVVRVSYYGRTHEFSPQDEHAWNASLGHSREISRTCSNESLTA